MLDRKSDKEWEKFGKRSPYFGVLSEDRYVNSHDTKDNLEEFFDSGTLHVDSVFQKIRATVAPDFSPQSILDFGCGVGRLVIPFSRVAEKTVGVDISESMLSEARKNCAERSIDNVEFVLSDDSLSLIDQKFDLIHSFIVFQHIPAKRGEQIFESLLEHLEEGGVCVIHFTYTKSTFKRKLAPLVKKFVPYSQYIANLIKGRDSWMPQMEMNSYSLNKIIMQIQKLDTQSVYTEFTNHDGELGVVLYFVKPRKNLPLIQK